MQPRTQEEDEEDEEDEDEASLPVSLCPHSPSSWDLNFLCLDHLKITSSWLLFGQSTLTRADLQVPLELEAPV